MSAVEDAQERATIGLSFGNSYSSIACTLGGEAKVIANEEGDRQIPSILSYVEGEEFHGTQAKAQLVRNPKNTVVAFRDFQGKSFDAIDPTPCHNSAHPQKEESTIAFSIRDTESETANTITVSEITTRHLRRLKDSASDYLGKPVGAAVVAIPTDFTDAQKEALKIAAQNAGFEISQFIHEPVAALLAHDARATVKPADKTVIVADLGGSRSDVAVVSIRGGMYTLLATTHDYTLGGAQLDEVLIEHAAKEFIKKNKTDPRTNDRGLAKLKLEAEAAKKALSIGSTAAFNVESLVDGVDFSLTVNRTRYELLASKVFARFTRLIENVVEKAELDVLDIDEIILSGGTSHTPRIATNVRTHFPESTTVIAPATWPNATNPSELTVRGTALQAYLIESFDREDVEQSTHPMVTATPHITHPVGLVVGAKGTEEFKSVIPANTPLPVRRTVTYVNANGDEKGILLRLCEGIREIKVTKPEPKAKPAKTSDDDEDSDDDDDDEEEEDVREKVWRVGTILGELALKDVKKGTKLTVQVNVSTEFEVTISAQESGKTGIRGIVPGTGSAASANGAAH